jgi:hypothetical protein
MKAKEMEGGGEDNIRKTGRLFIKKMGKDNITD